MCFHIHVVSITKLYTIKDVLGLADGLLALGIMVLGEIDHGDKFSNGYIPPEYCQSARATTKGDVYSFGVILLELVTGKEPTGPDFKESEGGNLVGWVVQKINRGKPIDVLDPLIVTVTLKQPMLRLLRIDMLCHAETPANLPTMLDVLRDLKEI